jgi:hypothetical protein
MFKEKKTIISITILLYKYLFFDGSCIFVLLNLKPFLSLWLVRDILATLSLLKEINNNNNNDKNKEEEEETT